MSELTDLEIRKQITLILINDKFPKASSIEYDDRQLCFWVETSGFSSWPLENPLTDDALCFMLMVKYDVERVYEPYDCIGWHYKCLLTQEKLILERTYFGKGEETPDISVNKAICLAIIELHK